MSSPRVPRPSSSGRPASGRVVRELSVRLAPLPDPEEDELGGHRVELPHLVALSDIDAKYGRVHPTAEILEMLGSKAPLRWAELGRGGALGRHTPLGSALVQMPVLAFLPCTI